MFCRKVYIQTKFRCRDQFPLHAGSESNQKWRKMKSNNHEIAKILPQFWQVRATFQLERIIQSLSTRGYLIVPIVTKGISGSRGGDIYPSDI